MGYWLVLASNRDEVWDRPTKPADFWGKNKDCISGQDIMPGREGGTWVGMNCSGKVAVLLNILGQFDPARQGRGHLISNYLSTNPNMHSYSEAVAAEQEKYNGFNLLLFDLGNSVDSFIHKPLYISNSLNYPSSVSLRTLPANTFHGVSNSPLEYPFQKVEKGKIKFRDVLTQYPSLAQKDYLIEGIFDLLQDRTSLLPDPILERAAASVGYSPTRTSQHSAVNVYAPQERHGTTISTVILIDGQGQVDYVERTRDFTSGNDPTMSTDHKTFTLNLTDQNDNTV